MGIILPNTRHFCNRYDPLNRFQLFLVARTKDAIGSYALNLIAQIAIGAYVTAHILANPRVDDLIVSRG
jgi:hypothetical protein